MQHKFEVVEILDADVFKNMSHKITDIGSDHLIINRFPNATGNTADVRTDKTIPEQEHTVFQAVYRLSAGSRFCHRCFFPYNT